MSDWTPKKTIVIGGVEFRLQYPDLYPDRFAYAEFQPIDRGYKCVLLLPAAQLKLLDGTLLRELAARWRQTAATIIATPSVKNSNTMAAVLQNCATQLEAFITTTKEKQR